MKFFRIEYQNGNKVTVIAKNSLEIVKEYNLATRENIGTKVIQLNDAENES